MERVTEGRERVVSPTRLFRGQQEAADRVVEALSAPGRQLIFLIGISGVGKTAVLSSIAEIIFQRNAVVPTERNSRLDFGRFRDKSIVSTFLPNQVDYIQKLMEQFPAHRSTLVLVAGMDEQETRTYVASQRRRDTILSNEHIVKFSMGIPLLVQTLALPGINEQTAKLTSARHFAISVARYTDTGIDPLLVVEAAKVYLKLPLPWEAYESYSLTEIRDKKIYEKLPEVLVRWSELRQSRLTEASPFFVAAQSEQIYDEVMQTKRENDLTIFVPHLSEADFQRLKWELGLSLEQGYTGVGRRVEMFMVNMQRKVSFWFRDRHGRVYAYANEYAAPLSAQEKRELIQDAYFFQIAVEEGEYPIGQPEEQGRSFLIHAHDHLYSNVKVAMLGWMMESWLQQRGIAYVAQNKGYGATYGYLPEQKKIVAAAVDKFVEGKKRLRAVPAYQRLRARLKKLNFQDGLPGNGLNLGDLIDMMFLDYGIKNINPSPSKLEEIYIIIDSLMDKVSLHVKRILTKGYSLLQKNAPGELSKKRYHSWLNLPVDLGQLISNFEDPEDPGSIGITSSEGHSLTIAKKQDSEDLYELVFPDLDEQDQHVAAIFREIGLPVRQQTS